MFVAAEEEDLVESHWKLELTLLDRKTLNAGLIENTKEVMSPAQRENNFIELMTSDRKLKVPREGSK